MKCCQAMVDANGLSASEIFGAADDMKIRSCTTLFSHLSARGSVFEILPDTQAARPVQHDPQRECQRSLYVGNAYPCVALVSAVDRDEIRRHGLHLTAVAKAAGEHASHPRDPIGKGLHDVGCLTVIAEDENVCVDGVRGLVEEEHCRNVMKGPNDLALGKNRCGLFCSGSLVNLQRERALLIEAEGIDTVNDDLADQRGTERP